MERKDEAGMTDERRQGTPFSFSRYLPPRMLAALLGALIFGLAAHGMGLLNKFSWRDDIEYLFDVGATVTSGRWMLHLLAVWEKAFYMDGSYSMPLFNGLMALGMIGLSAALITDLLDLQKKRYAFALGALMAVFPVITGLFGYVFTLHFYMLSLLMTVGGVWLICRGDRRWAWLPGMALGAGAMGIYQAFFPLAAGLLLLYDLRKLSEEDGPLSDFWKTALFQLVCLGGLLAMYFGVNQLMLRRLNAHLNTYMGIDQVGSTSAGTYLGRVGTAYRAFFLPPRGTVADMWPLRLRTFYDVMLLGDLVMGLRLAVRAWKKSPAKALLILGILGLIPLACNLIYVMGESVHGLMTYGQIAQIALFLYLLDRQTFERARLRQAVSLAAAAVLGLTGMLYVRLANQSYLKAAIEQEEVISFCTTLVTQIKSSADYRPDRPVLFLNERNKEDPTVTEIPEFDSIQTMNARYTALEYLGSGTWNLMMERWCGFQPEYYWDEGQRIENLPEVQAMPRYPEEGSIQVVNDILVVKF